MVTSHKTNLAIEGQKFVINDEYTYIGRSFKGQPVEGLLFNVRAVQATFDDENYPKTTIYNTDVGARSFVYPDGCWDPDRNVKEFVAALPIWRSMGILAVTLCFQGGRPCKDAWRLAPWYNIKQPYHNSGFTPDGELKDSYKERMSRVLEALDNLGMIAIVGYFYFGQDYHLRNEATVVRAVDEATKWLLKTGHKNIIVEVANETNPLFYTHDILKPKRVAELVERVKATTFEGRQLLASCSFTPFYPPNEAVTRVSDVVLPHGNSQTPEGHKKIIEGIRRLEAFRMHPQPIVFNEAGTEVACLNAAFENYASWGYYDHGANNYRNGFQSPPVNWLINTSEKKAFFKRVHEITQD